MINFESKLTEFKQGYITTLPNKVREIELSWAVFKKTGKRDILFELYRQCHSLTGSGSTYGLPELSSSARQLESLLRPHINTNSEASDPDHNQIEDGMNALRDLVELIVQDHDININSPEILSQRHPLSSDGGMKVLVADDNPDTRKLIVYQLTSMGHKVLEAVNGNEAVELFKLEAPDLVLMDIVMPEMDGYEATRIIKRLVKNTFVPVIFLTAANEDEDLNKGIQAGADDFLVKSSNSVILENKLHAFRRMRLMYGELEQYRNNTEEELVLAKQIFKAVLKRNNVISPSLEIWNVAAGHLSGDVQLHAESPNNETNILLGDFTGHGLPAAVGTLIAADIFYGMTAKGLDSYMILSEINNKLNNILPIGRYCAACFININHAKNEIRLWNCGLPNAFAVSDSAIIDYTFESRFMPLGIIKSNPDNYEPEIYPANRSALILTHTDGINEAMNENNELLGEDKVLQFIEECETHQDVFGHIKEQTLKFMGKVAAVDDISLVAIHPFISDDGNKG